MDTSSMFDIANTEEDGSLKSSATNYVCVKKKRRMIKHVRNDSRQDFA